MIAVASVLIIVHRSVATWSLPLSGFLYTWPLLILLSQGLIVGLLTPDFIAWDYARDALYIAKIPLIALASLSLGARISPEQLLTALILTGLGLAAVYLINYVRLDGTTLSRRALRVMVGRGYFGCVLGIVAAFFLIRSNTIRLMVLGFLLTAILVSTSRSLPALLGLYALAWVWGRSRGSTRLLLGSSILCITLLSFPPILSSISAVLLAISPASLQDVILEVSHTDFANYTAIQDNFRAFEARMAWEAAHDRSTLTQVFGSGFGSQVHLNVSVTLGATLAEQEAHQAVPITHISAMTALVKFGWIGLVIYLWALAPLAWWHNTGPASLRVINLGSALLLCYVVFVFQGFFAPLDILNLAIAILVLTKSLLARSPPP